MDRSKHLLFDLYCWLFIIFTLCCIGFIFIYSSSCVYALEKRGCASFFVQKQIKGFCISIVALCIAAFIPPSWVYRLAYIALMGAIVLTAITLWSYVGHAVHGSNRWLELASFLFQPSEFLKFSVIIACSRFLHTYHAHLATWPTKYYWYLAMVGVPVLILLKQPDFGMACTIAGTSIILFLIMHFTIRHCALITIAASTAIALLITYFPYRLKRVLIFLNPWNDPQGAGFQIIQSLIAIGSGGFWGVGIGCSKQKFFYLPMQHTDFIFSIIAEETGFIGCTVLLFLYALFTYYGMRIAWQLKNNFHMLVLIGFVTILTLQTLTNCAVALGLIPTKGVGLPFVSAGNSSLISAFIGIGIIIRMVIDAHAKKVAPSYQPFSFNKHHSSS